MKNSEKNSKHRKGAFRARKALQKFGYRVQRQMRALFSMIRLLTVKRNKTGTSQVGAISKAQKAQNIFFGKKLEIFEKKFFRKMSHSAEKCKRGTLFDL